MLLQAVLLRHLGFWVLFFYHQHTLKGFSPRERGCFLNFGEMISYENICTPSTASRTHTSNVVSICLDVM